MNIDFSIIKDDNIQYGNLAAFETVVVLLGLELWTRGRRLWRTHERLSGTIMLLAAGLVTLGWLALNALVVGTLLGLL